MKRLHLITFFILLVNLFSFSNGLASSTPLPATIDIPKPKVDECIPSPKKGSTDIKCNGILYSLHVPEVCLSKACGLITDIHGWMMTGDMQNYYTNLVDLAGDKGFIVIQPTARKTVYGRSWEYRRENVFKVFSFMKQVENAFHVMKERIHVTGFSQGSWMTWRFVCDYPDYIGSAAPIGFGAGSPKNLQRTPVTINVFNDCFKNQQIDILYAHGKKDQVVHYSGALSTVKKIGESWNMANAEVISKDDQHQRVRFTNSQGTTFEFISYNWVAKRSRSKDGDGHCFPGVDNYLGCGSNNPFHWGEEVLNFFLNHPKEL
tara:strand:+ start:4716 stop:5669 length:954 start_codon:yes stop_codon:yes gene_type:complete